MLIFVALLVGFEALNLSMVSQKDILTMTNNVREEQGLHSLTISPTLQEVAESKLADMFKNDYFSHTSPEGTTPWYWFDRAGYNFYLAGENLAMDFIFSKDVISAWMNSESHRKNILSKDFREVGVAVGSGEINGHKTVAIVEIFGSPDEKKQSHIIRSRHFVQAKGSEFFGSPGAQFQY